MVKLDFAALVSQHSTWAPDCRAESEATLPRDPTRVPENFRGRWTDTATCHNNQWGTLIVLAPWVTSVRGQVAKTGDAGMQQCNLNGQSRNGKLSWILRSFLNSSSRNIQPHAHPAATNAMHHTRAAQLTCILFLYAHTAWADSAPLVSTNGQTAAVPSWYIQSTSKTGSNDLASVSKFEGADTKLWHRVDRPFCTLVGCFINAGVYNDTELFFSENLKQVDESQFDVPWLYRAQFSLEPSQGTHFHLITHGITSRADIYVNGNQVADKSLQAGSYAGQQYDITKLASEQNALVVRVYPTAYNIDLAVGWADWHNAPADHGTGVWRPVEIKQTGPVVLGPLRVVTQLGTPIDSSPADVTLKSTARNLENAPVTVTVSAVVSPATNGGQTLSWEERVTLAPLSTMEISVSLTVESPAIWWPKQWGDQFLYSATLRVSVDGAASDSAGAQFGFRTVSSRRNSFGDIVFSVNGHPFQVLGGGYAPDLYLRFDPAKLRREMQYLIDLGLNTIRLEGKNEHPELYDLADRMGVMIMPGWECCDKWEAWSHNPLKDNYGPTPVWNDDDYVIANASIRHELSMMQTHPSVLGFLLGSDFWPDPKATAIYMDALEAVNWQTPIIISASSRGTDAASGLGPSGMRMEGPYDWVPPSYWWDNNDSLYGSAAGFGSELSAGGGTPDLPSLEKFLSQPDLEDLWKQPDKNLGSHMGSEASSFRNRSLFNRGLWRRYGAPTSLEDYVQKAQMADYEVTRAQFEAYASMWSNPNRPATGMIYWMLTGALPKLHWNLWDYYMRPSGNYFGAKQGGQMEHVAYDYARKSIWLINRSIDRSGQRRVDVQIIDGTGNTLHGDAVDVTTAPNSSKDILSLSSVMGRHVDKDIVFLKLVLFDGDGVLSRNVYWLPPKTSDVLDWDRSNWRHTPVSEFSDLTSLGSLPTATISAKVSLQGDGTERTAVVILENQSTVPALFIALSLVDDDGREVLPLTWSDNYVTLWPRESLTLTAKPLQGASGIPAAVRIWGRNVEQRKENISEDSSARMNAKSSKAFVLGIFAAVLVTLVLHTAMV
ncbi:glycoside hydrolase superfamily [Immersiella caudata]|uniref:Glycoside hydrolase superfamily n=1 Tax=Immersiella caudata TaxID=314043 RepID=A0AA40C802_9PEZI|nr:glycoside hydrolase superfamily [Immersiella caudata]